MPQYKLVTFKAMKDLEQEFQKTGSSPELDKRILEIYTQACELAESQNQINLEFTHKQTQQAKLVLETMEKIVKQRPGSTPEHIEDYMSRAEELLQRLKELPRLVLQDSQGLAAAHVPEYRSVHFTELPQLHNKALVAHFGDARKEGMKKNGLANALAERCNEYVKRGSLLLKQAQELYDKQVRADETNMLVTWKRIGAKLKDTRTTVQDDCERLNDTIMTKRTLFDSLEKQLGANGKSRLDQTGVKTILGQFLAIQATMKTARGIYKTLQIQADNFDQWAEDETVHSSVIVKSAEGKEIRASLEKARELIRAYTEKERTLEKRVAKLA